VIAPAPAHITRVDFTLPDLDGNEHQISEWDGKARLINFWATWCAPCRREIPLLKKTQTAHAENNLQVIGIAVEDLEPVIAYAEEAEFNYPVLIGQEDAMAAAEASGIDFIGLPFTMIVAPDGQLIKAHIGEIHEDQMALIIETFEQMRNGEIDIASARSALKTL
jgi:thiol-disulfide isomerase/thioredoxin